MRKIGQAGKMSRGKGTSREDEENGTSREGE